jgi:hypothetical protein
METLQAIDWSDILEPVLSLLATTIGMLLTAVLFKLFKRYGIELEAAQQAQIEHIVKQAALGVEERAAASLRSRRSGDQFPSTTKADAAIVEAQAKLPQVSAEELGRVLDSVLPQIGLGAAEAEASGVSHRQGPDLAPEEKE